MQYRMGIGDSGERTCLLHQSHESIEVGEALILLPRELFPSGLFCKNPNPKGGCRRRLRQSDQECRKDQGEVVPHHRKPFHADF
jgi:hypothetical protein